MGSNLSQDINIVFDLKGKAYGGSLTGDLKATDADGEKLAADLTLVNLDLADYGFLAEKLKHKLLGKLNGNISFNREGVNGAENGKADLRLRDGQLLFQEPLFGIASVDLQNIDLELDLNNREITVVKADLAGAEVKGSMNGSIQLQPDIRQSQLNLKGTLEPLAEFYKNYPEIRELLKSMKKRVKRGQYFFAITGTLGDPRFRLL